MNQPTNVTRRRFLSNTALGAGTLLLATRGASVAGAAAPRSTPPSGSYTPPPSSATGTIRIFNWGDPNDQAVYAAAAERFKAKYPERHRQRQLHAHHDVDRTTSTSSSQTSPPGSTPDVINIAIEGVRQGIAENLFTPLTTMSPMTQLAPRWWATWISACSTA